MPRKNPGADPEHDKAKLDSYAQELARKVNYLFQTIRKENGDRYLFTEVEEITRGAVTQSWLWRVSHGQVTSPSLWTLKALSDFFKINPAYWFNAPDDNLKEQVQAERDVQDIALRSLKLTSQGRKVILNLLKSFDQEDMYKKEENK
jgi:transcriptional regulator with XRE-family HTH domain